MMISTIRLIGLLLFVPVGWTSVLAATSGNLAAPQLIEVRKAGTGTSVSAPGLGDFYWTRNDIASARMLDVPDSSVKLLLWDERQPDGRTTPYYAISLDGRTVSRLQQADYRVRLRYRQS